MSLSSNKLRFTLTLYFSKTRVFMKASISSNLSVSKASSFFCRSTMLKPKIASMPLARQLSYIRKAISKGNLHPKTVNFVTHNRR
jgi:hypothetical protein